MQQLFDKTRSFSGSAASWEDGSFAKSSECFKSIIIKANSISLEKIFKYYNVDCGRHLKKIKCPFKSHSGGNESTPSFNYYIDTNTFYCFGCKKGQRPCDFVSEFEGLDRRDSAQKIIDIFKGDISDEYVDISSSYEDRLCVMMQFSNCVREVISTCGSENIYKIEKICKAYDDLNEKHNLNIDALKSIQEKLFIQILKLKE